MEPMFKITYKVTEDNLRELYKYSSFQRSSRIILNIVLLIAFLVDLFLTIFSNYTAGALIMVPFLYLLEVFLYFRKVSLAIKRGKEMKHDNMFTTYEFFENHLVFTASNGGKSEVNLSDIKHLEQTKNLVLLISKANLAYWFPIDSFEVGSIGELKSFLRSKGIKVKY